jgi:hypothetical protein
MATRPRIKRPDPQPHSFAARAESLFSQRLPAREVCGLRSAMRPFIAPGVDVSWRRARPGRRMNRVSARAPKGKTSVENKLQSHCYTWRPCARTDRPHHTPTQPIHAHSVPAAGHTRAVRGCGHMQPGRHPGLWRELRRTMRPGRDPHDTGKRFVKHVHVRRSRAAERHGPAHLQSWHVQL